MKYYKTFKDIGIGDCLYSCNKDVNKIYHHKVTEIFKGTSKVHFIFNGIPWHRICISLEDLELNKTDGGIFADINSLFDYINENA